MLLVVWWVVNLFWSPFPGVWQSFITIEVCRDNILALAQSCKKLLWVYLPAYCFSLKYNASIKFLECDQIEWKLRKMVEIKLLLAGTNGCLHKASLFFVLPTYIKVIHEVTVWSYYEWTLPKSKGWTEKIAEIISSHSLHMCFITHLTQARIAKDCNKIYAKSDPPAVIFCVTSDFTVNLAILKYCKKTSKPKHNFHQRTFEHWAGFLLPHFTPHQRNFCGQKLKEINPKLF